MSTKTQSHTPGPWRSGDAFNTVFGPPNGNPSPVTIADVRNGNEANARLIAAAPDLLAGAKILLAAWEDDGQDSHAADSLRAAIAKAGGF